MGEGKVKKPAKGKTPPDKTKEKQENARHELFCIYFTRPHTDTFSNSTLSYAESFDFDLDNLSRKQPKSKKGKKFEMSPYDKAYATCAVSGRRLIRKDNILKKINKRLEALYGSEGELNAELAKVAFQDNDYGSKLTAIRDINKLHRRLSPKEDLDNPLDAAAQPITRIEIVMPEGAKAKVV